MNKDEEEYILLSKVFGASLDMVQGTGGNISIKNDTTIIVKISGFALSDTSLKQGYCICNTKRLFEKFQGKDESVQETVLEGQGRPSMEVFFHLLPSKYIVHLHPTFLMNLLCQSDLTILQGMFPYSLCIPYIQPGFDLAETIHKVYEEQKIIFLQNHGVIFLEDSLDDLLRLIESTFLHIKNMIPFIRISDLSFLLSYYKLNPSFYIKPSFLIPTPCRVPRIRSLTPDYHLFLKKSYDSDVMVHEGYYYIAGPSKRYVENVEQLLTSYFLCYFDQECVEIPVDQTTLLQQNPLEKQRLAVFKQDG